LAQAILAQGSGGGTLGLMPVLLPLKLYHSGTSGPLVEQQWWWRRLQASSSLGNGQWKWCVGITFLMAALAVRAVGSAAGRV